jgi:hypothetical protein
MAEAITAIYVHENDDWTITVSGLGKELTARAPGIIAARDSTDQLVEKVLEDVDTKTKPTVVHLLNGSALDFTEAYMTARLSRPEGPPAPLEIPPPGSSMKPRAAPKPPIPQGKKLSKAVEARKSAASAPKSSPNKTPGPDAEYADIGSAPGGKPGGAMPAAKA